MHLSERNPVEISDEVKQWLNRSLEQIANTLNPRSRVEMEALRYGKKIKFDGGLGNPLRGFHPAAAYVRDIVSRAPKGNVYGRQGGMEQVIEAAQYFFQQVDGISLQKDQIFVNETGSCPLLGFLAEAMTKKPDNDTPSPYLDEENNLQVLIAAPAYGRHISVLPLRDVRYHLVDFWASKDVTFAQALEAAMVRCKPKLVVLSSVYNPTTRVMTEEEVADAVRITQDKEFGAVLFMDDAYRHVYRERRGPIPSVFTIPAAKTGKVVATWSASKGNQSPGQGGLLYGHPELVAMGRKLREFKGEGGFVPNQIALAAMLRDIPYIEETRKQYDLYFDRLVQTWKLAGWELAASDASIFIEARVPESLREAGWDADNFVSLLARNGVILYPSSFFKGHRRQRVRICANGDFSNIDMAAEVIHKLTSEPPSVDGNWPEV